MAVSGALGQAWPGWMSGVRNLSPMGWKKYHCDTLLGTDTLQLLEKNIKSSFQDVQIPIKGWSLEDNTGKQKLGATPL